MSEEPTTWQRCTAITYAGRPGRLLVRCILEAGHEETYPRSHQDDINERLCS